KSSPLYWAGLFRLEVPVAVTGGAGVRPTGGLDVQYGLDRPAARDVELAATSAEDSGASQSAGGGGHRSDPASVAGPGQGSTSARAQCAQLSDLSGRTLQERQ